jgi:hypothetical protein
MAGPVAAIPVPHSISAPWIGIPSRWCVVLAAHDCSHIAPCCRRQYDHQRYHRLPENIIAAPPVHILVLNSSLRHRVMAPATVAGLRDYLSDRAVGCERPSGHVHGPISHMSRLANSYLAHLIRQRSLVHVVLLGRPSRIPLPSGPTVSRTAEGSVLGRWRCSLPRPVASLDSSRL